MKKPTLQIVNVLPLDLFTQVFSCYSYVIKKCRTKSNNNIIAGLTKRSEKCSTGGKKLMS